MSACKSTCSTAASWNRPHRDLQSSWRINTLVQDAGIIRVMETLSAQSHRRSWRSPLAFCPGFRAGSGITLNTASTALAHKQGLLLLTEGCWWTNKSGFHIWIPLIRCIPCCMWPHLCTPQLRAHPCLAPTSSFYSEPYSALASLPSILQLYIPKSVTGRHELWLSFWSQQNPNPACQVTCHLCTVHLIKGHCVKVGAGRKKAEFALIAHQNKKLCLLREINVKALSLKSEHRAKSLGSFISIRKRNDC